MRGLPYLSPVYQGGGGGNFTPINKSLGVFQSGWGKLFHLGVILYPEDFFLTEVSMQGK